GDDAAKRGVAETHLRKQQSFRLSVGRSVVGAVADEPPLVDPIPRDAENALLSVDLAAREEVAAASRERHAAGQGDLPGAIVVVARLSAVDLRLESREILVE